MNESIEPNLTATDASIVNESQAKETQLKEPLQIEMEPGISKEEAEMNGATKKASSKAFDFADIRMAFIRKVYVILTIQFFLTTCMCFYTESQSSFKKFILDNTVVLYLMIGIQVTTLIILSCCMSRAKRSPFSYIFLILYTVSEMWLVSYASARFSPKTVTLAISLTMGITLALAIYACFTKDDITYCGGMLFTLAACFILMAFFYIFVRSQFSDLLYCIAGILLYSIYVIYESQLLVEGKRYELSMNDYIIASLLIYVDLVRIFLYILRILTIMGKR
eukprot:TRINITY_DN9857_c0_g1_i2.p1 TRINITY_DN9857_c0_g1~~TRINITY_DN9857_c0_g1_i2.p1  ORF type:complete len:279 (+),score=28.52 TRINITY_DN9857_c0_g1_i2:40-876(+)